MTNHVVRLYALALALLVFFVTWAAIAARPWTSHASSKADPRWAELARRQQLLRHDAIAVRRVVNRRWRVYRIRLAARKRQIATALRTHQQQLAAARSVAATASATPSAPSYSGSSAGGAAPSVRVVTLPPITITRTS
jgi:hypothetical protein